MDQDQNIVTQPQGNKKIIIIGIVVVAVVLVVGGLMYSFLGDKVGENVAENILENQFGGSANVDDGGKSFSLKNENINLGVGSAATWPSDMPSDIPKPTFGVMTFSGSVLEGEKGWQVVISEATQDDFSAYHSNLLSAGWKDQGVFQSEIGVIQMTKENNNLVATYNPQDKTFELIISVGK